jgi:hypothetical protein
MTRIMMASVPHVTSGWDFENFRPMDFCLTECTMNQMCKCILYYCHRESTQLQLTNIYIISNAQLTDKLLYCSLLHYSYMFRHYCVIFRQLVVSTCYVSKYVNAVVVIQFKISQMFSAVESECLKSLKILKTVLVTIK